MTCVNMYEAKTHFSKLIREALVGEEVIIAKAGKPLVKLVPVHQQFQKRIPGSAKGMVSVSDNYDTPLPDDLLETFYK